MADSDIQITAGSGTKVDTRTVGTGTDEHRQVIVVGDPSTASAVAGVTAANGLAVDVTRVTGSVTVAQATSSNLNVNVGNFPATQPVSGTVTANAGTGNFTVTQATASNLNANVSGTVTANAGTGSFTVAQATAANLNATVTGTITSNVGTGTRPVAGDVADDAVDSGNPVKIGAFAEANPSTSTMVADADRVNIHADIDGLLMTKPYTSYGDILVERLTNTDGASTASTVFGATASARNMITTIAVYNSSTTNGFIDFRDGTAGTVLFTLPVPAQGGAVTNFPVPLRQTTANTAFAYDVSAALTTVYISLIGFKSKV